MIEHDDYVTVWPPVDSAARVEANILDTLEGTLACGYQPTCVRVDVASYKALLARNGLETRSLRVHATDTLRVRLLGFDLPVDADARVPHDDAWVYSYQTPFVGQA
jgi:predicted exporter